MSLSSEDLRKLGDDTCDETNSKEESSVVSERQIVTKTFISVVKDTKSRWDEFLIFNKKMRKEKREREKEREKKRERESDGR